MTTKIWPRGHGTTRVLLKRPVTYVTTATLIPDGMNQFHNRAAGYMQVAPAYERPVSGLGDPSADLVKSMVRRGVHPERARVLVARAKHRIVKHGVVSRHSVAASKHGVGTGYRSGLGDDATAGPTLADVQSKGNDFQNAHRTLISQLAATEDDAGRMSIRNAVEGLYNDWTDWAVSVRGGVPPYQWNRTDPIDAILIAVRDDLKNTTDLLAANAYQKVLGKQISDMGRPGGLPKLSLDLPWYVWLGVAAGTVTVAKAAHLW